MARAQVEQMQKYQTFDNSGGLTGLNTLAISASGGALSGIGSATYTSAMSALGGNR